MNFELERSHERIPWGKLQPKTQFPGSIYTLFERLLRNRISLLFSVSVSPSLAFLELCRVSQIIISLILSRNEIGNSIMQLTHEKAYAIEIAPKKFCEIP